MGCIQGDGGGAGSVEAISINSQSTVRASWVREMGRNPETLAREELGSGGGEETGGRSK